MCWLIYGLRQRKLKAKVSYFYRQVRTKHIKIEISGYYYIFDTGVNSEVD